MPKTKEYVKKINTVSVVSLVINIVLALAKLLIGIFAFSPSLVSDAVHSLSDCFSTIVVLIGARVAAQKADKKHPYGHERLECIAALALSALLLATATFLLYEGVLLIIAIAQGEETKTPTVLALIAALVSIAVKGWMYVYAERTAKKLKSPALHADALHHLSDSFSSVGAVVGIVGSMCGVAMLEPVASLFIGLMIVKAAWDICRMAVNQLVDVAADDQTERRIAEAVLTVEGVQRIDILRTRQYVNRIFVDVEIAVSDELTLVEAHAIAERVHERVEHEIGESIKHCMVHVNPLTERDNHELPQDEMED